MKDLRYTIIHHNFRGQKFQVESSYKCAILENKKMDPLKLKCPEGSSWTIKLFRQILNYDHNSRSTKIWISRRIKRSNYLRSLK
jgi:hypothetical protein